MTRLAIIAVTCYTIGHAAGTIAAWATWARISHETRYRIGTPL